MDEPPVGQNVVVTLAGGEFCLAYWNDGQWWVGVDDDPIDAPLGAEVTSWAWPGDSE
jgi:hypothetical protein